MIRITVTLNPRDLSDTSGSLPLHSGRTSSPVLTPLSDSTVDFGPGSGVPGSRLPKDRLGDQSRGETPKRAGLRLETVCGFKASTRNNRQYQVNQDWVPLGPGTKTRAGGPMGDLEVPPLCWVRGLKVCL